MSLTGKWIELFYKTATGSTVKKIIFAPLLGLFYFCFIGFFILISIKTDSLLNLPRVAVPPINLYIGIPVMAAGFFMMAWSMYHFVKVKGTPVPLIPPPELVTDGPYRFARNPMLTGIFGQMFGIAILVDSLSLFFVFTSLFIAVNVWELKKVEEPELEKRLGERYRDYKKKVPMFFPWKRN